MLNTPILLITFNRPDHVGRVLTEILKQEPQELYICQDGAREGNDMDRIKCREVRDVVNELTSAYAFDHNDFTLRTLYQEQNLGCGPGPAAGIDWFFSQVEKGIIMEDDCLPHPDFFAYCEDMLNRYNDNPNVQFINATLYHDRWKCEASYGFSRYMVTGAWAAWRETWQGFDLDMHTWKAWQFRKQVKKLTHSTTEANWWYWKLKEIQVDTEKKSYWDYQMQMHLFRNDAVTIHPSKNLISNIGFDAEGTHTLSNDGRGDREVFGILPLTHPTEKNINHPMDVDCFGKTQPQSCYKNIVQFLYQYMLRSHGVLHALLILYKKIKNKPLTSNLIMTKVLYINTSDSHGGAARAAVRIMHGIKQHGVEAQMLVKDKHSASEDVVALQQFIPQCKLYRALDWIATKIKNKWQHLQWRPYRKTKENIFMSDTRGTRLHGALQQLDYDVLHLHWINQRFVKLQDLPKDKPIVWTLHDSWPFCGVCHYFIDCQRYQTHCGDCPMLHSGKERDLAYRIFEEKLRAYRDLNLHIVTPSRWLGECAKQSALFGRFPVTVIPNCLETDVYRPLSEQEMNERLSVAIQRNPALHSVKCAAGGKAAKPLILYGAMNAATDRIKGFASLLSALQTLDKQGFEANLVVFGANESDLPMQFEHICVHFIGYVSDTDLLVTLYNLADVMVVPSLTENLSCAIMESLSCGTPVCCFDIGGNSDMVGHQVNGYLAKEKEAEDLAQGIRWCLENNKDGALSTVARKKVMENYTIERVGEMYVELYSSLEARGKI